MGQLIVTGKVAGNKVARVRLSPESENRLGRKILGGDRVREMLETLDLPHGTPIVVEMSNSRMVDAIFAESEYTGLSTALASQEKSAADAAVDAFDTDLTPPEGMFPCIPESDPGYILPKNLVEPLGVILELLRTDDRLSFLLTGPQGTGKTSLARIVAEELQYNLVKVDCGGIREQGDWWTRIVAKNGSTYAIPTQFVYAMTTPRTVILLDEVNRTHPKNHNSIYGLLDEFGTSWSDDLQTYVTRAPEVLIIATANVGEDNVGVYPMDSALLDRFPFQFELAIPPKAVLSRIIQNRVPVSPEQADALGQLSDEIAAKVGKTLSHYGGIRPLIAAAKMLTKGLDFEAACAYTVCATFDHDEHDVDSERTIVMTMVQGIAGSLTGAASTGPTWQA